MAHLTKGFVVLFAALLLATFAQPAFALPYGSWGAPIITDATGDSLASPNNGGTDIWKLYYANNGVNNYFRMDIAGTISTSDYANLYGIVLNSSNPADPSSIGAVAFPLFGTLTMIPYGSPGTDFLRTGSTLEWSIPNSELSGAFTFYGITLSTRAQGFIADTTTATPIPGAAWLLGSGLVGLIGLKRRKGRTNKG